NKNIAAPRYSKFSWMIAAASGLLVVGLTWLFVIKQQKTSLNSAATVEIPTKTLNNTLQKMPLTLSDGSSVELLPNSTLSYPQNFSSLKRAVVLKGEAVFTIAKDAGKTFSVRSNNVVITVLGTRFSVSSDEAKNTTKVVLNEGRVMVTVKANEYYLNPGD